MVGEVALKRVKAGEIIQLQRKGFFRCDVPYNKISTLSNREQPLILFHIPDGHSTITLPGASDKAAIKTSKEVNILDFIAFYYTCRFPAIHWKKNKRATQESNVHL